MIILEPTAGLCNRLIALDSSIAFSRDTKQTLHVTWRLNKDCNCKFSDLFEIPEGINGLDETHWSVPRIIKEKAKRVLCYFGWRKLYESKQVRSINTYDLNFSNDKKTIHFRTCYEFYKSSLPMKRFTPKATIQKKIETYRNDNAIGVHIRRTDNINSIQESPIEAFYDLMDKEIKKNDKILFFLCTDDPIIEKQVCERYQGRIYSHPKRSLDRNTPEAIEDAVIDLYSMGNCQKIIGSECSTFTKFAAHINNIEYITAKK